MDSVSQVNVGTRSFEDFAPVVGQSRVGELGELAATLREQMAGRVLWNVNSTATGGGVAEMLQSIVPYIRGVGIDARWAVIHGNPNFFRVTKRLHNALHGWIGDGSPLGNDERFIYETLLCKVAADLLSLIKPGDIVLLHDPQTAGLVPYVAARSALAVWRCHIGDDNSSEETSRGWAFLAPYLKKAHAFVFTRHSYIPECCNNGRSAVIPPSIDAFSTKNQAMDQATVKAILIQAGIIGGSNSTVPPAFLSAKDQTTRKVVRAAQFVRTGPPPSLETPLVVQVSRWDSLKDPLGVLRGFASMLGQGGGNGAHLVLAGPDVTAVADDPEGAGVLKEVSELWQSMPAALRQRIHLALLPMEDLEENAAIVNAIQRHATVVVQKSLQEGFGLTVTEAMWKAKAVLASAVGGIRDQIEDGVHGLLVSDPTDLTGFARLLGQLLQDREKARQLGENAHQRVREEFLGIRHLGQYATLLLKLKNGGPGCG